MTNSNIIKLAGILALISMLFLPLAGCGTITFSGLDIIKSDDTDSTIKILLIAAIVAGILVIVLKSKGKIFLSSIVGIVLLVISYIYMKSNLNPKDDVIGGLNDLSTSGNNLFGMDASDIIELKAGSYLAVISFLVVAFIARSKKELMAPQSAPADKPADTDRPPGIN